MTTLGDREAILEFAKDCEVFRVARMIHSRGEWEGEPAEIHCTLAAKYRLQLIYEAQQRNRDMERKMNHFRVEIDRNKTEFSARMDSLWEQYGEIAEQRAVGLEGMIQRVEQHLVVREDSMRIMGKGPQQSAGTSGTTRGCCSCSSSSKYSAQSKFPIDGS